jgi:REP element-mobilizing transposase RayT
MGSGPARFAHRDPCPGNSMAIRTTVSNPGGEIYFITFTCFQWRPLFEWATAYDDVYKWFDVLRSKGHSILGYVIMPNHLHVLIRFGYTSTSLNSIVSNAKRFMAYAIVSRLEKAGKHQVLFELKSALKPVENNRGQKHRIFKESFDAKLCLNDWFLQQKLAYMHQNPIKGKWRLASHANFYPHSSAGFYAGNQCSLYKQIERVL